MLVVQVYVPQCRTTNLSHCPTRATHDAAPLAHPELVSLFHAQRVHVPVLFVPLDQAGTSTFRPPKMLEQKVLCEADRYQELLSRTLPRGSKYLILREVGLQYRINDGFWNLDPWRLEQPL